MRRQDGLFPNKKYCSFRNGNHIISFPPYVSAATFEKILKECYRRTKNKSVEEIKFDLAEVSSFDIFALGLTCLWLLELKNKKTKVEVEFPSIKSNAYGFLENYGFEEFLNKNNISYTKQSKAKGKPYVGFDGAEFLPLKFAFESEYKEYLDRLSVEGESGALLGLIKEFEVVRGGELRNTILKELRDNIQIHADDKLPYIMMTKFKSLKKIEQQVRYGIEWERRFFYNLLQLYRKGEMSDPTYFEIVIGDGGPGIHNTLGKIEDCKDKKEYEILDYAFEYDSTSDPERRREPAKKLWGDLEKYDKFPPATGLYQVKQVVKKYSGFLTVRSGKTILCYDFLSYPTTGHPEHTVITNLTWQFKDRGMKDLRKLSSFKGTHYKILFPVHPISYLARRKYFEIPSYELYPRHIFKYEIISLKKYFPTSMDLYRQLGVLQGVFKEIMKDIDFLKKGISLPNRGIVLVDFNDIAPGILSRKALHYLVLEMMRRQDSPVAIVGVNVDEKTLSEMKIICFKVQENKSGSENSLVILDENLEIEFLGSTEEAQGILENLVKKSIDIDRISKDAQWVIDQNHHIIDVIEDKYYLSFPYKQVVKRLSQNLGNEIKEIILDNFNKIFHPNARVNIPNRYHVEGFFEIWKLVENSLWRNKLQRWVKLNLKLLNPTVIITIGKPCQKLIESIDFQIIKWTSVVNPWERLPLAEFITLDKKDKIIILTDVIGTGESLNKILKFISEREISEILTIVDARAKEISIDEYKYNGHSYKLESIVRKPLNFHIEGKPGDWSYETIKLVEPTTNALLAEPIRPPEEPLWFKTEPPKEYMIDEDKIQDFPNPFIEDVALFSDGVITGHFTTKSKKHIPYFFLVERIAKYYAREIAKVIKKHINDIRKKSQKELNISHILYPEYNPGVKEIVSYISSFVGGKLQSVTNDEIFNISTERTWDFGKIETVVIFDDSFSSGFTLKRLIDIAYRANAKFIFAYILMDRADYFTTRFLSNLPYYGRADNQIELQIKHLVDARIPTFDISHCPICRYIKKLESIKQEMKSNYCRSFLDKEIKKWEPTSIESLQEEHILKDYLSIPKEQRAEKCSLRWKLEIAKERIGARNELKRIVKNYEKKPQKVLNFLDVLYQEILYFFEIQKERYNEVFYFKKEIKKALEFFTKEPKILSKNLGAILLVWYFIDPEDLLNHLEGILDTIMENEDIEVLFEAIGYILIGENFSGGKHSVVTIGVLNLFRTKLEKLNDPTPHFELGNVIKYLESKAEKLIPSPLYKNYRLATSGIYFYNYEVPTIKGKLKKDENKEEPARSFERVIKESDEKLRGIKAILESDLLTHSERQELNKNYEKLQQIVQKFNRNLLLNVSLSRKDLIEFVTEFSEAINCIDDALKLFECDIKNVIEANLKKEKILKLTEKYQIAKPEIVIGEKADSAFIREDHMGRILEELFENLSWAFAGTITSPRVKIVTKLHSDEFLRLEMLDNGNIPTGNKYGGGHFLIRNIAEKYGGRFYPLEEIRPHEDFWNEGYRKRSILYIGCILSPQDERRIRK